MGNVSNSPVTVKAKKPNGEEPEQAPAQTMSSEKPFLVYQLGTNNWQFGDEYAPGSGILHEAHHTAYNSMPGVKCYSIYPSKTQDAAAVKASRKDGDTVEVLKIPHDIPVAESNSPNSNKRWHSMPMEKQPDKEIDDSFETYKDRLVDAVCKQIDAAEEKEGAHFKLGIAHHSFINVLVLREVNKIREAQKKPKFMLACFVHGTGLKMYKNELSKLPEYPMRFYEMIQKEGIFNPGTNPLDSVQICYVISATQKEVFTKLFPEFPAEKVVLSPNGINMEVFKPLDGYEPENKVAKLKEDFEVDFGDSDKYNKPLAGDKLKHLVVMVAKYADWKRIDTVIEAQKQLEEKDVPVALVVAGGGPDKDGDRLKDMAKGLRVAMIGPKPQGELAKLYTMADVGCFPSYHEPFGMVFIECMACGTPVIGADSGGPKNFVDDSVGVLVKDTENNDFENPEVIKELADRLVPAIETALKDDWKSTKGKAGFKLATEKYTVKEQCRRLLEASKEAMAELAKSKV